MDLARQAHEELDVKYRQKYHRQRRIRALLLVINIFLIGYALIFLLISVKDRIGDFIAEIKGHNPTISLCSYSVAKSEKIYQQQLNPGKMVVNDYAFIGQQLIVSEYKIDPRPNIESGEFLLFNACTSTTSRVSFNKDYNDQLIDLTSLDVGDYLLMYEQNGQSKNLTTTKTIQDKIFLLPNKNGIRHSVTIKSHKDNPNIVVSVKEEKLATNIADFVFDSKQIRLFDAIITRLKAINPHYQIVQLNQQLSELERLQNMMSWQPRFIISIDDLATNQQIIVQSSIYLQTKFNFTDDKFLAITKALATYPSVDESYIIRESGGKLTGAQSCRQQIGLDSCLSLASASIGSQAVTLNIDPNLSLLEENSQDLIIGNFIQQFMVSYKELIGG